MACKRGPRQIEGRLAAGYGKLAGHNPDIVYNWGAGCAKADSWLMHHALCGGRFNPLTQKLDKSFVEELVERG